LGSVFASALAVLIFRIRFLTSRVGGVRYALMNSDFVSDIRAFVSLLWQYRPFFVVMIAAGVIVFVLMTIDTHRHRKKQKRRHKRLH